jgi:hypothetical protein
MKKGIEFHPPPRAHRVERECLASGLRLRPLAPAAIVVPVVLVVSLSANVASHHGFLGNGLSQRPVPITPIFQVEPTEKSAPQPKNAPNHHPDAHRRPQDYVKPSHFIHGWFLSRPLSSTSPVAG